VSINILEDFIIIVKNVIPPELCDAILDEYKNCNDWQDPPKVDSDARLSRGRKCQVIYTSEKDNLLYNNIRTQLDNEIFTFVAKCLETYVTKFPTCVVSQDTGYDLLKYATNDYYKQHTDSFLGNPRETSCSLLLNDDFEGGEFAFFDGQLKYKLNKGDALMFPSNFMFPHEVMKVTEGTRYAIITWFR
jgi:predicted 2-oxoglutarate/Fe(II)-dependent dioxygenase YbiX